MPRDDPAFRGLNRACFFFGTESAVLLDLAAEIDRATPVVFLDTGKLFPETLAYRDALIDRLGLTDVRIVTPASLQIATHDANGALWRQNADRCCTLRKTLPLQAVLGGFSAWITGRKRFQAKGRGALQVFEREPSGRVKVNPLAHWTEQRIARHFASGICRVIRWKPMASPPSAARPARCQWRPARIAVQDAGPARPRRNAASIRRCRRRVEIALSATGRIFREPIVPRAAKVALARGRVRIGRSFWVGTPRP